MFAYLAIFLLSAATLLLELTLLRLFAVQQFYHFAFMAVSLALLGAGASGSILSMQGRRRALSDQPGAAGKRDHPRRQAAFCLGFGVSTVTAFLIINYLPFDSFSIAWDGRQVFFLALYFLSAAIPFVFAGLVVGCALMGAGADGGNSHRVYGANLLGSALGSLGSLPALAALGGEGATMLAAALGAGAGLLFLLSRRRRGAKPGRGLAALLLALTLGSLWLATQRPAFLVLRLSPYKSLSVLLQTPDARRTLTHWSAASRLDVVESSSIHVMPGLSLRATVPVPPQAGVFVDGDNLMPLNNLSPKATQAAALAQAMPQGLVYALRPGARTLVLEAGTGLDVLLALAAGAQEVTAVEENGLIIDVVQDDYASFTDDLYGRWQVAVVEQSGRVFARGLMAQEDAAGGYDVIVLALNDTHRPITSGAYSLTENYLYTVQAFGDYLAALDDEGLLLITRWLQTPPSESLRTFAMLAQAMRDAEDDPARQIIAYRTMRTMTFIAGARPFTNAEIETVRAFLQAQNFDGVLYPGIVREELNRYNVLPEAAYHNLFRDILRTPQETYAAYRFDIRPASDDRPFFFHTFKWRQTPQILATLGATWQPFGGSGYFVLLALLLLVLLASALLILGPLLWRAAQDGDEGHEALNAVPHWRLRVFLFFAALGLGFLFVELPLAQRFILVLDEPVTALAVVLFSILLFSGLGSLTVRLWRLSRALVLLVLAIAVYPLLLEPFSALALRFTDNDRIFLTILAIAPAGYLMGLPFAAGLRLVEERDPPLVPWAWAINGSFSVISAILAVMVALSWGFSVVLWLGAAAYALALLALGLGMKHDPLTLPPPA